MNIPTSTPSMETLMEMQRFREAQIQQQANAPLLDALTALTAEIVSLKRQLASSSEASTAGPSQDPPAAG